jgi:Mn2+/Fe2+ NRAMP family transporter
LLHSAVLVALFVSFHFQGYFPWWVAWPLRLTAIALGVAEVTRSRRGMNWRRLPRLLFLVWLAVSLLTLVLAAIDRFQRSDLVLLAVVFAILAATRLVSWAVSERFEADGLKLRG